MFYDLPTSVEIGGAEWPIRSDFRAALDIVQVMGDPELDDGDRTQLSLEFFLEDWVEVADIGPVLHTWEEVAFGPRGNLEEAIERLFWFIRGGKEEDSARKPRLMDWEQDFQLIAPPVNRVLGFECREAPYLHWWSFLAAYYEIGDCLFAQVVSIRKKRALGKRLDKSDKAFAKENADIVNLKVRRTSSEEAVIDDWI